MNVTGFGAVPLEKAFTNADRVTGPIVDADLSACRVGMLCQLRAKPIRRNDRVGVSKGDPARTVIQGQRSPKRSRRPYAVRLKSNDLCSVSNRDRRRSVSAGVKNDDHLHRLRVKKRIRRRLADRLQTVTEEQFLVVNWDHYTNHFLPHMVSRQVSVMPPPRQSENG